MMGCCDGSQDGEGENTGKIQGNTKRRGERGRGTQEIERDRKGYQTNKMLKSGYR